MDRNTVLKMVLLEPDPSLSARRAWIEILRRGKIDHIGDVALRKESVDRNN